MTLILAIESAGEHLSIAIQSGNQTVYSAGLFLPHAHSQLTSSFIQAGIQSIGKRISDLNAVAVGSGPGSYTGLRIGLSVAKGICFGCDIPLISVGGLENMAFQAFEKCPGTEAVVVCLPARKDEFFYAAFSKDGTHLVSPAAGNTRGIQLSEVLLPFSSVLVCGKSAEEFVEKCGITRSAKVDETVAPLVKFTAQLSFEKWKAGLFEDTAAFEPAYLKPVYISGR